MTDLRQAAQQALEALEDERYVTKYTHIVDAIKHLRTALEQQAEPVKDIGVEQDKRNWLARAAAMMTRDTTPPASQRKPLMPAEIAAFVGTHGFGPEQLKWFRYAEAAHGIKEGT